MNLVANHLLIALINHEYQHDQWIDAVTRLDGYLVCDSQHLLRSA